MKTLFVFLLMTASLSISLSAQHILYLSGEGPDEPVVDLSTDPDGSQRIDSVAQPFLRVYSPLGGVPSKGIVVIAPGGSYRMLSVTKEGSDVATRLAQEGYTGVVLHYRLGRQAPIEDGVPVPQRDGLAAMHLLRTRQQSGELPDVPVYLMGFSAGGHLAASLSQLLPAEDRPDGVILLYPVISMREGITHQGSLDNLLGENPDPALVDRYSAEEHVTADLPPTLLIHAQDDGAVPLENSLLYAAALREAGVATTLLQLETGGHGFGMRSELGWVEVMLSWLARQAK